MKAIIILLAIVGITYAGSCTSCVSGTSGDCIAASLVCFPKSSSGSCPQGTSDCGGGPSPPTPPVDGMVGSYLMLTGSVSDNQAKMNAMASASNLPMTHLFIAFIRPDMVYEQNSLKSTGLKLGTGSDEGFAELKSFISAMQAKGIKVTLSMGGWDWSCNPYQYMQYSIYQYGPSPNYWKINTYGGGSPSGCTEANGWCYVCEPEFEPRVIDDFAIWPHPSSASQSKVKSKQSSARFELLTPGSTWTDSKTGRTEPVPGNGDYLTKGTNPYYDFVQMSHDLGLNAVDVDYEEIWYSDAYGTGNGPYDNSQVIYKFGGIIYDFVDAIAAIHPGMELSTAVTCQGADDGNWWGGNMKGQVVKTFDMFPDLKNAFTSMEVMTYDVSSNPQFHECPDDKSANCALNKQVNFYMNQFKQLGIDGLSVGYEIGQPAYPDITNDPSHQLPLSTSEFNLIQQNTQGDFKNGFIWETYKQSTSKGDITAADVLNGICTTLGGSSCNGSIPSANLGEVNSGEFLH